MIRRRKIELTRCPQVTAGSFHNQWITVETGTFKPYERVIATAKLSMYDTANLIRQLRKALRETSTDIQAVATKAVQAAEGPL